MSELKHFRMLIEVKTPRGTKYFRLGRPKSASRRVLFHENPVASSNAFFLPLPQSKTYKTMNFTSDVSQGGSCNVELLTYCPHNITHLETSAHVLSHGTSTTVDQLPLEQHVGLFFLIDLEDNHTMTDRNFILWEDVEPKLQKNDLPINMLGLKTRASRLPEHHDFSGQDFLALHPETARQIHDYSQHGSKVQYLILDLPSADPEHDEGKLLAHRNFFGLPEVGHEMDDPEKRALIELAYFKDIDEGYYHAVIVPVRFQTNAVAIHVLLFPLEPMT